VSNEPQRFKSNGGLIPRRARKELTSLLSRGEVVALPTETVYGLAARADLPEAIERLRLLKNRPANMPLTWHVGDFQAIANVELKNSVARLAQKYWPGPLTLIVRGADDRLASVSDDGWTGIRLPAHTGTREFLATLDFPIVMTSANQTGEPPLTTADQIVDVFGESLLGLVDDGPSRIGQASTVLRIGRGTFEVLREGLLSLSDLKRTAGLRIAFTCTGNTCRSPLAEALTRLALGEALGVEPDQIEYFGFEVSSMGVFASPGSPAANHSVTIMNQRGIDLSKHQAQIASEDLVARQDIVFGLTESHVDALRAMLPTRQQRQVQLLDPEGYGVPDPIGGSLEHYADCAEVIAAAIARRIHEWI
jgi:L-threonylcarbamoyladenylate synthase